ncbi:MAG: hypothetical protein J7641_20495 [Cyanobacteria bacterium SID2]|nr:hypothetical protein [Cyanobacteria bacterium SID2]MBP0003508.1 hypothetical protein [Cyanobacteria bacterium SBC]
MNPQSDWQRRLQELELDLERSTRSSNHEPTPESGSPNTLKALYQQARTWFQSLPTIGQVAVGIGGVVLALAVLQTVFRLVTLAISLTILAAIVYGIYRLVSNKTEA